MAADSYSTDRELMQACLALLDEIGAEPAIPWWTYKRGVDLRVALKTRLESDAPSGPSVPSEKAATEAQPSAILPPTGSVKDTLDPSR